MKNQSVDYQELEFMVHLESSKQRKSSLASKLNQIWNWLVESITASNEPKIYSRTSKSGSNYWEIHDPLFGRRVFFNSETEVRDWLDRHYFE